MIRKLLLSCLVILLANNICNADSIPEFQHTENITIHYPVFESLNDSDLTHYQIYNPAFIHNRFSAYGGNLGAPVVSFSRPNELLHQENSGLNALSIYEYSPLSVNKHLQQNRFSRIKYNVGGKQEQQLRVQHQQRAFKGLTVGLDFNVMGSPGFYSRQLNKQRSFNTFVNYYSRDNRYNFDGHYTSNRFESEESGGIVDDSLFVNAENLNANLVGINLSDASSRFQSRFYSFQHSLGLSQFKDSASAEDKHKQYRFRLHHKFMVERTNRLFEVNSFNTDYFKNFYRDSARTKDSLFIRNFINVFGLSFNNYNTLSNSSVLEYRLHGFVNRHDYRFWLYDREKELVMYDLTLGARVAINKQFAFEAMLIEGIEESDESLLFASAEFALFDGKGGLRFSYKDKSYRPDLISQNYSGNHFVWENDFEQIEMQELSADLTITNIAQVTAGQRSFSNYVYYDQLGIPQQFSPEILYHFLNFESKQSVGNFNFRENIRLQDTDHPELIRVPDFAIFASTYYENIFLKQKFPVQIGLDWRYNTSYFELEYNPATMQFQLQNKQEIGEYLYVDLFFNFRIKSAMLFMKMAHINEGFSDRNYFLLPYHPMSGRAFRFGIQWTFDD